MITIQISDENWKILNVMKKPGETFDSVLQVILQQSNIKENMQGLTSAENNSGVEAPLFLTSTTSAPSQSKIKVNKHDNTRV